MAYEALLFRVLEDRHIDEIEGNALVETAERWGLSTEQVERAHQDYLHRLAVAAVADQIVTESERRDLELVARLLGQNPGAFATVLAEASLMMAETNISSTPVPHSHDALIGKVVCFTGELQCRLHGQAITRGVAQRVATEAGCVIATAVTKKLDLLVLADPHSQSGKAKKARQYGVRIVHENVFWSSIGIPVE
jgi:DNA polymerase-3 subunit epsilon